jgi:hypothetical protein
VSIFKFWAYYGLCKCWFLKIVVFFILLFL